MLMGELREGCADCSWTVDGNNIMDAPVITVSPFVASSLLRVCVRVQKLFVMATFLKNNKRIYRIDRDRKREGGGREGGRERRREGDYELEIETCNCGCYF